MAKSPTITIKVNAAEVQKFADIFNKLSGQITGITKAFSTLQTQTTQTAKSVQALNSSLAGMLATSNRLHTSITGITHQFGRWATLIGGTIMMLGGGAGMFGLDRLLNSFIQRQRQALGAGLLSKKLRRLQLLDNNFRGTLSRSLRIFNKRKVIQNILDMHSYDPVRQIFWGLILLV
jgi:hypothetical protein